jgi:hypothetical protein
VMTAHPGLYLYYFSDSIDAYGYKIYDIGNWTRRYPAGKWDCSWAIPFLTVLFEFLLIAWSKYDMPQKNIVCAF